MELQRYAQTNLPTGFGTFKIIVYHNSLSKDETVVISIGDFSPDQIVFTRVHSECFTGEVLNSLKCDCRAQLEFAMEKIQELNSGVIIYLRQEGRGIGLGNKIRAYALQEEGANTIEANHILGFPDDLRDFTIAAEILKDLGITKIALNTNNPDKIKALQQAGIVIEKVIPSLTEVNPHNAEYLRVKKESMGHFLDGII